MRDLIEDGTLDVSTAALLWSLLVRGSSLMVVAGPSGAGKTTLLTALLDFLPEDERRIHLRGAYDPFAFLDDASVDPVGTALLVNEISPHLPIYLWGPAVRRLFQAAERGFRILATAHATSAQELVRMLAGYPLRVPPTEIATLDVVVVLHAWREGGAVRRRVSEVTALESSPRGGVLLRPLLSDGSTEQRLDIEAAAAWLNQHHEMDTDARNDLADREKALRSLIVPPT